MRIPTRSIVNSFLGSHLLKCVKPGLSFALCLLFSLASNAGAQEAVGRIGTVGQIGTISVDTYNNLAVTANRSGLVHFYDVTKPDQPTGVSTLTLPMNLSKAVLANHFALLAGQGGVQVLDISNPQSPVLGHKVGLDGDVQAAVSAGDLGYAAVGATVVVFDLKSGAILDRRVYSTLPVSDMAISKDYLYLVSSDKLPGSRYQVIKLAVGAVLGDPVASFTSEAAQTGAGRVSLYAGNGLVYIAAVATNGSPAGLTILEDSDSAFAVKGLQQQIDAQIVRPTGRELLAYTGTGKQGVPALQVLNSSNPTSVGGTLQSFNTPAAVYEMTLNGEYAYLASGNAGPKVMRFVQPNGTKVQPMLLMDSSVTPESSLGESLMRMTADVTASDQVRKVDFYINGTKVATDGNYPFEYRVSTTQVDPLSLAYACVEDIDGNSFCSEPSPIGKTKSTLQITSVTPAHGSKTVRSAKLALTAQFSLPLDTTTVLARNVSISMLSKTSATAKAIPVLSVTYQAATKTVTIQPKSALASGDYKVTLSSAIKSSTGTSMTADYTYSFTVTGVTDTWVNPESGNWNTATNWSTGVVPANGDDIVIAVPGVVVSLTTGAPEIDTVTVGSTSTLAIAGGNLAVTGSASVAGTLNLSSGEWGGPAGATIGTLNLSGGLLANGTPVSVSKMSWTGGGIGGVVNIPSGATLSMATPFNTSFYMSGGTLNNSGTVTQSFAGTPGAYQGVALSNGSVINNLAGGVWNVVSDVWVYPGDSTANAFNNAGTFNKTGGTNTTLWNVSTGGGGPINVNIGTLSLGGSYAARTITGTIAIATNAILNYGQGGTFSGGNVTGAGTLNFTASASVTGTYSFAGLTQILGGTVSFASPTSIANLNLSAGALAGAGPVTVTTMGWTGGGITGVVNIPAGATLTMATPFNTSFYMSGGKLNNAGTVTQSFAGTPGSYQGVALSNGSVINNYAGGVWNVVSDVWMYSTDSTANSFNNSGTFNKTGGTNTTLWTVSTGAAGPINIASGTFTLNNGLYSRSVTSPITIATNAVLNYGQGGTLSAGNVAGAGTLNFTASASVAGAYSFTGLTQILAGTVSFAGATSIANLNLNAGGLSGAGPVTVTKMNWTGGGIAGVLNIPTGASLNMATPFNTSFSMSGGTINNSGTVTQSFAGTPGAYQGVAMSNSSVINNLAGGVWNVVSDVWIYAIDSTPTAFNNSGTFNKTGGSNTTLWNISTGGAGPININAGTFSMGGLYATRTITGPIAIATNAILNYGQGGTFNGGNVTGAGTLNFTASASVTGTYSFAGLTQILGGSISFASPTNIANLNLSAGALSGAGPVTVTKMNWTGGGITGVVNIPAGATLTMATPFNTSFYMSGGKLNNAGTVTQSFAGTPGAYQGVALSNGSVINNYAGGVWNVASDVWVYSTDQTANSFNNSGTFNKTGGTQTTLWTLSTGASGPININAGTFTMNNALYSRSVTSPITIASNAVLNYGQGGTLSAGNVSGAGTMNFTASASISGAYSFTGLTQILAGNVSFGGSTSIASLNLSAGAMSGAGQVTATKMSWTGGGIGGVVNIPSGGTLNMAMPFNTSFTMSGGTINNAGTVTQSFAGTPGAYQGVALSNSSVINNLAGGVWNVVSDVWVYPTDQTANAFNNAGTFNKTAGTSTTLWNVSFKSTGTVNLNAGNFNLGGFFPSTSQLSGTTNIASPAVLNYAQQGTLSSGSMAGTGTFNISTSSSSGGSTNVTGNYSITVPSNVLGGTLEVKASATLNVSQLSLSGTSLTVDSLANLIANTVSLSGANFSVSGNTSIGKLNVSTTSGSSPTGSNVSGNGTINVTDTLTWNGGSVSVTGVFNVNNMTLSSNSAINFKLGSSAFSVNAKLSLNGTLTLTPTGSNPAVGTAFKIINFANSYLGDFASFTLPIVGTNDYLKESLDTSGLSFVVTPNGQ